MSILIRAEFRGVKFADGKPAQSRVMFSNPIWTYCRGESKSKLSEQMTRNSNTYPRRGSSSGFYVEYIERLIQRRAAKGEQKADLDAEEQYWRERERLHAERQQIKRAA
jgi:hypothetical protein